MLTAQKQMYSNYGYNNDVFAHTDIRTMSANALLSHNVCPSNFYKQRINELKINNVMLNLRTILFVM